MKKDKVVVVISGGLDSTTLAHRVHAFGYDVYGISFDYGQQHGNKELRCAQYQLGEIGAKDHKVVKLPFFETLFADSGSALITDTDVPEGHYAAESMKDTVVPNRNMIMLSIAIGYAVSIDALMVATGVHGGDHFIYPDCRPEFINGLEQTARYANDGFINPNFSIMTPYITRTKNEIAVDAFQLGVQIDKTWSCYKGGKVHCGKCGTCVERLEAIDYAITYLDKHKEMRHVDEPKGELIDPTEYEDTEYWKEALANG